MEFEVQSTIAPIYGMTSVLMDAINAKYDSISNLNSIKLSAEEENFEDINPVIDSIIEDENNHIGKLQQLIDLLSDSEDAIAEGKAETVEIIDNPEIMESITMKKKLVLNENFDNVIDDVQAVADPVFVGANEEHDENKKKYEDAMKENKKEAEETVPKEGETGKKVSSKELKSMKLSEALFDESLNPELIRFCGENIAEYILTEFVDLQNSEIREVLKWVMKHFSGPDFEESLDEGIQRYSDAVPYEERKYWYFTTHGVGPGSIPKDLKVLEVREGQNDKGTWGDYVCLDGVLSTSELREYDMIEKAPMNEDYALDKGGYTQNSKDSFVAEWWGQTEEDPEEVASRYGLSVKPLKRNRDEVLYMFKGNAKNIRDAIKDGYFYSIEIGEDAGHSDDLNESLQYKIAKEQIQRFTEGKMPKNWSVDNYLKKLTEKKHITRKEATSLKEWYNGRQKR